MADTNNTSAPVAEAEKTGSEDISGSGPAITAGDSAATPDAAVQTTDQAAGQAPAIVEHIDKVAELAAENPTGLYQLVQDNLDTLPAMAIQYGSKLILAILVLIIGWLLVGRMVHLLDKVMDRHGVETTLQRFMMSITGISLKIVLLVIFASMVGVETASLVALLGAAGLAVGLALQGSLSNFAGGVIVLFFKPFKAGDVIEAQGYIGRVEEIQIFNTKLKTLDNQVIYIPNGLLSNGCIKNLFAEPTRRVDLTFGISYGDDIPKVKKILQQVCEEDPRILKDPVPEILVSAHADSSINLLVRPWVKSEDYWLVHFDMMEKVKMVFDREGVTIPFPQRDVHFFPASDAR